MQTIAVLLNPSSGKGRAVKMKNVLKNKLNSLDIPYKLFISESENHLIELTRKCLKNFATIVGVGGDSTFTIIINELIEKSPDITFGMIGLGSSDDIVKEFGIETLEKACLVIKNQRVRYIDLGCIETDGKTLQLFPGQANIGLGVSVNRYVNSIIKKYKILKTAQSLTGILAIYSAYRKKDVPIPLTITWKEGEIREEFIIGLFTNIRFWATGKRFAPQALPDDGQLDCILVRSCSFKRLLKLAFDSISGKHISQKEVIQIRAPSFTISSVMPFQVQIDGEILRNKCTELEFHSVKFSIKKRALKILC